MDATPRNPVEMDPETEALIARLVAADLVDDTPTLFASSDPRFPPTPPLDPTEPAWGFDANEDGNEDEQEGSPTIGDTENEAVQGTNHFLTQAEFEAWWNSEEDTDDAGRWNVAPEQTRGGGWEDVNEDGGRWRVNTGVETTSTLAYRGRETSVGWGPETRVGGWEDVDEDAERWKAHDFKPGDGESSGDGPVELLPVRGPTTEEKGKGKEKEEVEDGNTNDEAQTKEDASDRGKEEDGFGSNNGWNNEDADLVLLVGRMSHPFLFVFLSSLPPSSFSSRTLSTLTNIPN